MKTVYYIIVDHYTVYEIIHCCVQCKISETELANGIE